MATYTTDCVDCGTSIELRSRPPRGGMSCGTGACVEAHNQRGAAAQAAGRRQAEETRAHRRDNPPRLVGDPAGINAVLALGRMPCRSA